MLLSATAMASTPAIGAISYECPVVMPQTGDPLFASIMQIFPTSFDAGDAHVDFTPLPQKSTRKSASIRQIIQHRALGF